MKKGYLLLLLCGMFYMATAQQKDPVVNQFFEQMGRGNWIGAMAHMDANMKKNVTPDMLNGIWQQLEQTHGKWTAFTSQQATRERGFTMVLADNSFANGIVTFRVVLDSTHRIAGFFIAATKQKKVALRSNESIDSVTTADQGTLSGTLTMPDGNTPCPIVLIIAGSGPTDRNGNNPLSTPRNGSSYQQLAAALASQGIASLRYDKRGIGESRGFTKPAAATTLDDYTSDAAIWLAHLEKDPRFKSVSVIGHSEGALIGMKLATDHPLKNLVSLAGPGETMDQLLLAQLKPKLQGGDYQQAVDILNALREGKDPDNVPTSLHMLFNPSLYNFWKSTFHFDPCALMKEIRVPVLILNGAADVQVPAQQATGLQQCKPDAQMTLIPGMSHSLKNTLSSTSPQDGSPSPLSAELIPAVVKFIQP